MECDGEKVIDCTPEQLQGCEAVYAQSDMSKIEYLEFSCCDNKLHEEATRKIKDKVEKFGPDTKAGKFWTKVLAARSDVCADCNYQLDFQYRKTPECSTRFGILPSVHNMCKKDGYATTQCTYRKSGTNGEVSKSCLARKHVTNRYN